MDAHAVSMAAGLAFIALPPGAGAIWLQLTSPNPSAAEAVLADHRIPVLGSSDSAAATRSDHGCRHRLEETAGHRLPIALDSRPTAKLRALLAIQSGGQRGSLLRHLAVTKQSLHGIAPCHVQRPTTRFRPSYRVVCSGQTDFSPKAWAG